MSTERYSDKDLLMLKGLYHTSIAKKYFETAKIDQVFSIKEIFNKYIIKLEYILTSVLCMTEGESRKVFEGEITKGDTLFFDALMDKLPNLSQPQRENIELIVDAYLRNEKVDFIDETKK